MLNEAKLSGVLGGHPFRPMQDEEIQQVFKAPAGYLGPVGIPAFQSGQGSETQQLLLEGLPLIYADLALKGRKNLIAGANKHNFHLKYVTPGRDFGVTDYADLRNAAEG